MPQRTINSRGSRQWFRLYRIPEQSIPLLLQRKDVGERGEAERYFARDLGKRIDQDELLPHRYVSIYRQTGSKGYRKGHIERLPVVEVGRYGDVER